MTRIFDALKKAHATRPASVSTLAPVPQPAAPPGAPHFGAATGRTAAAGLAGRAAEPRAGFPLAVAVDVSGEMERQMISLRVNLEAALGERSPRVVIFLSSQSREGTSTVVQQFCRVLARDGDLSVLLLDAHVERPCLVLDEARRVAVPVRHLSHGRSRGEEAEILPNLRALPVPESHRSARIYPTEAAREALESAVGAFDWVVIDGPPVLEAPDAASLAGVADGVVMVVRAGRTKRPVLARAVDLLRKGGARVIGTVLNGRQLEIPEFIYRRI